jgi:hypothetical protein
MVELAPPPTPKPPPPVPQPDPEPEPVETPEAVTAPERAPEVLPEVDLPDARVREGVPNGLVGIDCYAVFRDPDRAAECAGREVRSDWRSAVRTMAPDFEREALVPGFAEEGIALPASEAAAYDLAILKKRAEQRRRSLSPVTVGGGPAPFGGGGLSDIGTGGAMEYNAPPSAVTSYTDRRIAEEEAQRREEAERQRRLREAR